MIYYRPFTWHLLAVLYYLKSHFATKIIICTKAGEHYAASVLAALISNFTSANPDLIDDVYNFHDLHDDEEDEGKPKKPLRLICNRHGLDPEKTLIVDDNATSWFDKDRKVTNFWMPPCYGYQIHDIDNELQLLCKYLWDPIQQNHLKKKATAKQQREQQHVQRHDHLQSDATDSDSSQNPSHSPKRVEIISRQSPKSISCKSNTLSPKNMQYLHSPNSKKSLSVSHHSNHGNSPRSVPPQFQDNLSATYSSSSLSKGHNVENGQEEEEKVNVTSISRISRSYNKRKENGGTLAMPSQPIHCGKTQKCSSPKSPPTKTKKKGYFFESKSRGSKKLAKMIGK
jgi:hypothetical protein